MKTTTRFLTGLLLSSFMAASALANVLVSNAPFAESNFGQQTDANSASYSQMFVAPAGSILESIRWWGFHGLDSMGASFDNFVVTLDGVVQTGALSVVSSSAFFDEYTLDIADTALSGSVLSIVNDSFDVEWYWQSAPAEGNPFAPDASAVAFSLIGHFDETPPGNGVPEPQTLLLVLGAIGMMALAKLRKAI